MSNPKNKGRGNEQMSRSISTSVLCGLRNSFLRHYLSEEGILLSQMEFAIVPGPGALKGP